MRYLIGIDEAGRGPLAGPVSVGAVVVRHDFDFSLLAGVRDSKKLTPLARGAWYNRLLVMRREEQLDFAVALSSAAVIDKRGIVFAIRSALARALTRLAVAPDQCEVRLDGSLRAPEEYRAQKTIIRGDDLEPIISIASIAAKVTRDRIMNRFARRYPGYGFEEHKGYGTAPHRALIKEKGFCEIHRTTFCTRIFDLDQRPRIARTLQND